MKYQWDQYEDEKLLQHLTIGDLYFAAYAIISNSGESPENIEAADKFCKTLVALEVNQYNSHIFFHNPVTPLMLCHMPMCVFHRIKEMYEHAMDTSCHVQGMNAETAPRNLSFWFEFIEDSIPPANENDVGGFKLSEDALQDVMKYLRDSCHDTRSKELLAMLNGYGQLDENEE